jgi:drug/metabolite transporter (DMT)-like permease
VAAAFLAVYIIWGSTYLAIRFVIETIPPFFMAGTRFLIAGLALYAVARFRSGSHATKFHWRSAFVIGGLMLLGGHGAVIWAEQWVPSGLTSLLIATVPLWMVLVDSVRNRAKPGLAVVVALALGFAGVALMVGGVESLGGSQVDLAGAAILVFGAFLWANGSLYSRSARLPSSQLLATALEMTAGGLLLLLASLVLGEWTMVRFDQVSDRSLFSWLYLIVFGALVAFTCYVWLLKVSTPSRVSTYAYVNPVVAMLLGATLAEETLTIQNVLAAAIILTSVVITTTHGTKSPVVRQTEKRNDQQDSNCA